jgi:tetratricopeptide (TPR) repeat protein
MTQPGSLSQRNMRALLVFGTGCACAFLLYAIQGPSAASWLARGDADWIVYPHVPRTTSHPVRPVETTFEREIEQSMEGPLFVATRCLGPCRVEVNGRSLVTDELLKPGKRTVRVRASRDDGPPVLSFVVSEGADGPVLLASDESWMASQDGSTPLPAALASDRVRAPAPSPPPIPWLAVAALVLLGAGASLGAERLRGLGGRGRGLLLGGIALAWSALLWRNLGSLPGFVGFDVEHHLFYLRFVLERGAIPSPSDGVQTYQPPLFYLLSAGWLRALGLHPADASAVFALRTFTFALGLWHLLGTYLCVRMVLPGREAAALRALLFASAAPLHLALFHAYSNEALVAALSTAALWTLLRALRSSELGAVHGLVIGALVGAALLAKLSALVLVPIAIGALLVQRPRGAAAPCAALSLLFVSGWYYVPVALEFGTPFVGNWDERVGFAWWGDPGVRDLSAYLRFGGALADPWFAGFDSIWDGVYSTFFADGLASGERSRLLGPAWNHGLARAAVWLGLLPSGLVALGIARGVLGVWRRPDASGLALVGLGVAMFAAFVFMTLRVPSYAQAKAIYWSPALVALFAALALGFDTLERRSRLAGRIASAGLCAWAAVSFAVFWIDADAPPTLRSRGERALAAGRPEEALRHFERVASAVAGPGPVWAEVGICRAHAMAGRFAQAARACEAALGRAPGDADALFHAAVVARRSGDSSDWARALELLERMQASAPLDERAAPVIASLAGRLGRPERARSAAREWLRFDPGNPEAIAILAR